MIIVVSCYSDAGIRFFDTHCKWLQCNWPRQVPCFINLAVYKCKHWRVLVDFLYKKLINTGQYLLVIWKSIRGLFFEPQCRFHFFYCRQIFPTRPINEQSWTRKLCYWRYQKIKSISIKPTAVIFKWLVG